MRTALFVLASLIAMHTATRADTVSFQIIGVGYATSVSAAGTAIAGNTAFDYETFRWTEETGIVPLGRATVPVLGRGAGLPEISADGTRISATILGASEDYITQGLWTEGAGWVETMPPVPPSGGLIDLAYGSAWGLSDDGQHLVGLYWRPGHGGEFGDGLAHACIWSQRTGVVDLASVNDSRANDVSRDGRVVVGWQERYDGAWQPVVWVNGARTVLADTEAFAEATVVNADGTIVAGQDINEANWTTVPALWRWNGTSWVESLMGTLPSNSSAYPNDMTPDGNTVVGTTTYAGGMTGFIWTPGTGMVDVEDYLENHGVILDPNFDITSLTGISDNGDVMVGTGSDRIPPYLPRSFVIRVSDPSGLSDGRDRGATQNLGLRPNPMGSRVELSFDLTREDRVAIEILDTTGRVVRRLFDGTLDRGHTTLSWDGTDGAGRPAGSGAYFCRVRSSNANLVKGLILTR